MIDQFEDQFPKKISFKIIIFFEKAVKEIHLWVWRNLLPKNMLMIIFFVDQNLKNLPLSKILDIEKLNNVDKPIEDSKWPTK